MRKCVCVLYTYTTHVVVGFCVTNILAVPVEDTTSGVLGVWNAQMMGIHIFRHEASLKRWVGAEAKSEGDADKARKSWLEQMLPETSEQKRLARREAKQASQLDKLMIACNKGKLQEVERLLQPEIGGMHKHAPTPA